MRVGLPEKIFAAISEIQSSSDPEIFVKKLLRDTLQWPVVIDDIDEFDFDDIGYDWHAELESMGLKSEEGITGLFQIAPFPGWPMGMFVVKFGSNSIFTKGRGMTTPLRNLLRNVIEKARPDEPWDRWAQDQLLFMCHHEHQYFQFVRFTEMDGENLPKLQTFGWGPEDDYRTLCTDNLPFFFYNPNHSQQEVIEELGKAFDVERVSKRFYDDYKETFKQFKQDMIQETKIADSDEIHQHVQLIFNRFLFLRFIEKKGWMNFGEGSNYLSNLFKHSNEQSSQFYSDHFLPMVLKGLCSKGHQSSDKYGVVPLIGGGLFEQSPLDKKINKLPNDLFKPIIGSKGLLYKYNFTVLESTPLDVQVAIDPEMIGTMFEELVTDRDGKGAFYTPRIVVSYMCKEGLKSILEEKTGVSTEKLVQLIDKERSETITEVEAKKIREELDGLKAIDPACGSGAYLLGLLQEIVKIHENLSTIPGELKRTKYQLKLHIISRSIYGVDIEPFATQIAMLRLWLSLAVESDEPVQLPNLDFNIETGDSLLAPDPSQVDWFASDLIMAADRLAEKKEKYVIETEDIEKLRLEIINEQNRIRTEFRKNKNLKGSVDFRVQFAGVFSKNGGFDLVLANPPYVRQEDIKPDDFKTRLYDFYKIGSIVPVQKKSDLYCYFYVRAQQLLRTSGVQIFICSNTWLDVAFGAPLQNYFLKKSTIIKILDSAVEKQFSSAEVNTIITFIKKKSATPKNKVIFISLQGSFVSSISNPKYQKKRLVLQQDLYDSGSVTGKGYQGTKWSNNLRAPEIYWEIIEKHSKNLVQFKDVANVKFGTKTGCNKFFYLSKDIIAEWGIEKQFIVSIMKSSQQSKRTHPVQTEFGLSLFYCGLSKQRLQGTNALRYIEWGEESHIVIDKNGKPKEMKRFNDRPTTKSRNYWYFVGERNPPPLIGPKSMNEMYKPFRNKESVFIGDRLYEVYPVKGFEDEINALMQSTYFSFMLELGARTGLGQGLLDLMVYELENILIPNPKIFEGLKPLNRKYMKIENELKMADRIELDKKIFSAIGLEESRIKEFYIAYSVLVSKRLGRAITVTN